MFLIKWYQSIPPLVSIEDNVCLTSLPLADEIKGTGFDLNGDGTPGLDGFGGHLYQHFGDIHY